MHVHGDHSHADGWSANRSALTIELAHHLPFSVSSVAIGLTFAGIICFVTPAGPAFAPVADHPEHARVENHEPAREGSVLPEHASPQAEISAAHDHHAHDNPFLSLFHLFHPMHMLFSAAATTAMFWRYERRVLKAMIIGIIGAVGVCGVSDIVIPQLSLSILGKSLPWHICLIQHPQLVLPFAAVGVIIGLTAAQSVSRSTFLWHSLHVFSSTMASIFYLIGPFGRLGWIDSIGIVFVFIVVAVMVPCCFSDIGFPLLLVRSAREKYQGEHVACG
jgi:hypothetical protein